MALPPAFLDELRARTPLPSRIGRKTRLAKSGRNWKGCCPFHGEKTPSFYVYDDHFHCFGCGAHGDAITFVMRAEGASFTFQSDPHPPHPGRLDVDRHAREHRLDQRLLERLGCLCDLCAWSNLLSDHSVLQHHAQQLGLDARRSLGDRA